MAIMKRTNITADNATFVILSFEGPDRYSLAGGLGVRVADLSQSLAKAGFLTHLFFVGDPKASGQEIKDRLILHRWCQWISEYYPLGVYQGESDKLCDFNESIPAFVAENIIKPAVMQDKIVVVLGEEWQTAEAICRLSDYLHQCGLREKVVMFWNANNTFGFDRINWGRLSHATTITTVSRYMKHIMQEMGLNPLVISNGIQSSLLDKVDKHASVRLRGAIKGDLMLAKVARWDPDKHWESAIEATAGLKARGVGAMLLARGSIEPYGAELMHIAHLLGLSVQDVCARADNLDGYLQAIESVGGGDILNIRFHCPQEFLRLIYNCSDAVLANSGHEPFGLVGLETMAAGGIAFLGSAGEDYAFHFRNCIVLETSDYKEIEDYVIYLYEHPGEVERIRKTARVIARQFTWGFIIRILVQKLEYQARIQCLLSPQSELPVYDDHASVHPQTLLKREGILCR